MNTSNLPFSALLIGLVTCLGTSAAHAQYRARLSYEHRVNVRPRYGYHPAYGYHPIGAYGYSPYGTAAGSTGIGVGAAAIGIGQYQQDHQQAAEQYIKNQGLAVETYAKNKQIRDKFGEQYRQAEKAHEDQVVAAHAKVMAQMAAPHRLTSEQFDRTHNVINWPYVLRDPVFGDVRYQIDKLYHARTPDNSGEGSENYAAIKQACDKLEAIIKDQVRKDAMSATDFVTAKHFATSLCYEGRFSTGSSR